MKSYYFKEQQQEYGVIGIEIEVIYNKENCNE